MDERQAAAAVAVAVAVGQEKDHCNRPRKALSGWTKCLCEKQAGCRTTQSAASGSVGEGVLSGQS